MMNLRNLKIGWRVLIGDPIYSIVVIAGLSLAMAACFLLLGYVHDSFSYDAQVPLRDRIFQIKQHMDGEPTWEKGMQLPFAQVVRDSGLAEQSSFAYVTDHIVRYQNHSVEINLTIVEPDFEKIFGLTALEGSVSESLSEPDAIALTVATAKKILGDVHGLHKIIEVGGSSYRVTAIVPDPPSNTNMPYEALSGVKTQVWSALQRDDQMKNWNLLSSWIFVKTRRNVIPQQIESVLQVFNDRFSRYSHKTGQKYPVTPDDAAYSNIRLQPLAELHFDESLNEHGNKMVVTGLALVALLILLIAAVNYVNLAIVRTIRRQKEIGLHKVMGAGRWQIIQRFVGESLLVCLLATLAGMVITWLLLPWFADLIGHNLDHLLTLPNCSVALLVGLLIGLLTGSYPAWVALHTNARMSLAGRGQVETRGGLWVRRVLTILQFAVAMGLTAMTITILWQTRYASMVDPGYDPSNLLVLEVGADFNDFDYPDSAESLAKLAFPTKLAALSGVVGVAASLNAPGRDENQMLVEVKSQTNSAVQLSRQYVTQNFFEIYQLKARAGRLFDAERDTLDDGHHVVLNWVAARMLGFSTPEAAIGKTIIARDGTLTVIGIAPDIRQRSMRTALQPTIYFAKRYAPGATPILTVRTDRNSARVEQEIEKIWSISFPTKTQNLRSARQSIADNYAEDLRYARVLLAASVLTISIAAFGLYVLSAYSLQRRTREIVLRKLHGASEASIAQLIMREFGLLLVIGALIGLPVAYLAGSRYLAEFVEQAPIGIWALMFALFVAAGVACFATLRQVWIAMGVRPVEAFFE